MKTYEEIHADACLYVAKMFPHLNNEVTFSALVSAYEAAYLKGCDDAFIIARNIVNRKHKNP